MACLSVPIRLLCTASVFFTLGFTLGGCSGNRTNTPDDLGGMDPGDFAQPPKLPGGCGLVGSLHQVSNLTGLHGYPRISTNGTGYAVAWVTALATMPTTFRIDAELTDHEGAPMGPNIPLSADAIATSDPPSISPVVGGLTMAWTRATGTATDIVITTMDTTGQKLDSTGATCAPTNLGCGILPITTSGTARTPFLERPFGDQHITGPTEDQLGVAFIDSRNYTCGTPPCGGSNDVFWKRIQTDGTELLFDKQLTGGLNDKYASPRLAFDGFHQGVVWRDITSGLSSDLYFTTIDNMGQTTASPSKIGASSGMNSQSTPDLVWDGSDYSLVSATGSDTTAAVIYQRQSTTGSSALSARGVTFGGSACTPSIAYDGAGYGIVYQLDCGKAGSDLAFVRVDKTGVRYALDGTSCATSVDPACGRVLVSHNEREGASQPMMVYGGDGEFGIVWMQGMDGASLLNDLPLEVYIQRVSCE